MPQDFYQISIYYIMYLACKRLNLHLENFHSPWVTKSEQKNVSQPSKNNGFHLQQSQHEI
jgi:hypothetical protein